jgi:hypothetical protein
MPFIPALGQSDFRKLRESGAGYVDKTAFISELLADPAEVLLFPRPRRFGKTLFLSTLACFLERSDTDISHLFQDLAIWSDLVARPHFQQHPVIFLTFKDVNTRSYASTLDAIRTEVQRLYSRHHCVPRSVPRLAAARPPGAA